MGVATTNLPPASTVSEVIGNLSADGIVRTVRMPLSALATQLLADGPIATAVAGVQSGMIVAATLEDLDLAHPAKTGAWVMGSAGGIYRKLGASGTGSWERIGDLPSGIVRAVDAGLGSASAIRVTTLGGVSEGAFVCFVAYRANDGGPVTVSIDDGPALGLIGLVGAPVTTAGAIPAGMPVLARVEATSLRLLSDQASAAILAAAEAALSTVQALVTAVESVVPIAAGTVGMPLFKLALRDAGRLRDVIDFLPADPSSSVRVAWDAMWVSPGGIVASWLASDSTADPPGPGLSPTEISSVFASSLTQVL